MFAPQKQDPWCRPIGRRKAERNGVTHEAVGLAAMCWRPVGRMRIVTCDATCALTRVGRVVPPGYFGRMSGRLKCPL